MPSLNELVARGAEVTLKEVEARNRARDRALKTFVSRLVAVPALDLDEIAAIRHPNLTP